ncbi:MAG: zinc ribbon domain-containing protein [Candidatus Goldbacteria bacterium]|nr:zinc ribbon domain-containing protein [Candidatus Goldiibacteriota bacterium]
MYCRHCGKQVEEDSKFCRLCGGSLAALPEAVKPERNITARKQDDENPIGEEPFIEITPEEYRHITLSPEARKREEKLKREREEKDKLNRMLRSAVIRELLKEGPGDKWEKTEKKQKVKKQDSAPVDPRINVYKQAMDLKKDGPKKPKY